jgi:hypothetical protein
MCLEVPTQRFYYQAIEIKKPSIFDLGLHLFGQAFW